MVRIEQKNQALVATRPDGTPSFVNVDENGNLVMSADVAVHLDATGVDGDSIGTYGYDISGTATKILVDDAGHNQVDILTDPVLEYANDSVTVYGSTGVAINQDAEGHVHVDVETVPSQRTVVYTVPAAMAISATDDSGVIDAIAFTQMNIMATSDVASATDGIVIKQGNAIGKMKTVLTSTLTSGISEIYFVDIAARYVQVTYTNGVTAATDVDIVVILNKA
ncbi:MAG: hypothetical protein KJ769_08410 [Candidatus Margulisbacteria bacterium]|nr:hypothetical protein [Candidatus Margulisiibacteriota bacterium]